ncbi:MAG: ABC transporter ATP-binding protein [Selenomonadaceae bacterium]|nr:ABC transporter ATP-binding protein [Selenomonadaceae bacterium]
MAQVRIEHLYKRFGDVTAVGDFNIDIQEGEFISFLGPSGCGKTTTLRMVAGFERATEGNIIIDDRIVSSSDQGIFVPPEKRGVGMVFQSYAVWPHMTVAENVGYPLKIQKVPKEERQARVQEMLEMVRLGEYGDRYPNQLSGGQQQRVSLARALVMRPGLLLLDEPLSNLDAKLRESMRFEISAIQKKLGITVIYVTHDQSEAMTMSDRIVVMSMGVVQQIGTPYEIYTRPANKMVADFVGLINFIPAEQKGDRAFIKGTNFSVPYDGAPKDELQIAVRPENITMSVNGGAIAGTIEEFFYLGDSVDYRVLVGDTIIRVIEKGAELGALKIGDKVFLDMDKVMVF